MLHLHTTGISHPSRPWGAPLPAAPTLGCAHTPPNSSSRSHVFCKSQLKAPISPQASSCSGCWSFPGSTAARRPLPGALPVAGAGTHRPRRREIPALRASQAGMLRAEGFHRGRSGAAAARPRPPGGRLLPRLRTAPGEMPEEGGKDGRAGRAAVTTGAPR